MSCSICISAGIDAAPISASPPGTSGVSAGGSGASAEAGHRLADGVAWVGPLRRGIRPARNLGGLGSSLAQNRRPPRRPRAGRRVRRSGLASGNRGRAAAGGGCHGRRRGCSVRAGDRHDRRNAWQAAAADTGHLDLDGRRLAARIRCGGRCSPTCRSCFPRSQPGTWAGSCGTRPGSACMITRRRAS